MVQVALLKDPLCVQQDKEKKCLRVLPIVTALLRVLMVGVIIALSVIDVWMIVLQRIIMSLF
jgi:hypothetical protein